MRASVAVGAGLVAIILAGCTHRQELSASGAGLEVGDQVEVRTVDGADHQGTIVKGPLGGYRVRVARPGQELELAQLRTVSRQSRGRGALDGLLIGAALGAIFGVALAAATYDEDEPGFVGPDSKEGVIILNGAAWGLIGGLVGAVGGATGAATMVYQAPPR